MNVEELNQEDIFQLVDLMQQCDDVLSEAHSNWNDIFMNEGFAPIKAAMIFWARISQNLLIPDYTCTEDIPAIIREDIEIYDFIEDVPEYLMQGFDIATPSKQCLEKIGISMMITEFNYQMIEDFIEDAEKRAKESKNLLSEQEIEVEGKSLMMEQIFSEFSVQFPEFAQDFINYVEEIDFYATEIVILRSERIGRWMKNQELLYTCLPKKLFDATIFLIKAVFSPLYVCFLETCMQELGKEEYWGVYTLGYVESDGEEVYELHKRPYGTVAVTLLGKVLTIAEELVPEILIPKENDTEESRRKIKIGGCVREKTNE